MRRFIYIIFILGITCFSIDIYASSSGEQIIEILRGKVVDSKGEGVPFATVALTREMDSQKKVISLSLCKEDGTFSFLDIPRGEYSLEVSSIGYASGKFMIVAEAGRADLGIFKIHDGVELNAVRVVADKPLIKAETNKLVYDVENDPDAAKLSTLEILNKVPFIQVDKITDKIQVMGEERGFSIIINGKKSLLLSEANQYVTKLLQAGQLKQVELITAPDGKYFKQTAVINIITKSSLSDGIIGEISISGSNLVSASSGFRVTSKIGHFIYNANYKYGYSNLYGSKVNTSAINYTDNELRFSQSYLRDAPGPSNTHNAGISASYNISDMDLVAVDLKTSFEDGSSNLFSHSKYMNSDNIVTREFNINSSNSIYNVHYIGSVDYQRSFRDRSKKLFTATYSFDNRKNEYRYDKVTEAITGYTSSRDLSYNNLNNFEQTAACDFYNTIGNNQNYFLTAKYVNRRYSSDARLSSMNYLQQVSSLLCNYSLIGSKLMFSAQFGFEHTDNNIHFGTDHTDVNNNDNAIIANIRFNYRPTYRSMFALFLSREYFRPDITFLNPYEDKSIAGQITKGNPDLENQKSYYTMFMYRYFVRKSLSLRAIAYVRYSDNAVKQYSYLNSDGILISTYGNISKEMNMAISLGVNYNPTSWLEINLNGSLARRSFKYPGNENSYWNPMSTISFTSDLWSGANFSAQVQYISQNFAAMNDVQSSKQNMRVDGIFDYSQMVGTRFKVRVSLQNPWQTYIVKNIEQTSSEFYQRSENRSLGRSISINLTYNFGHFKELVKSAKRAVRNTDRNKSEGL